MNQISSLIEDYSRGPQLVRSALEGIAETHLDQLPIEGTWSIRQVVCHLADSDIVYVDRMKRVIAEDNPTFFDADPDLLVPGLFCERRRLDVELDLIESVRAHMLPILLSCNETHFGRNGIHSTDGPMSLETLLQRVTLHVPHHLAFVEKKVAALARQ